MIRKWVIQNITIAFIVLVHFSPALLASDRGAVLYPAPPGIEPSRDFRVQVDGRDCCYVKSQVFFSRLNGALLPLG